MWSDTCNPITLANSLSEIPAEADINALLTLAHFYQLNPKINQYIGELEPLLVNRVDLKLENAHLSFLKGAQLQSVGKWNDSWELFESALSVYKNLNEVRGVIETTLRVAALHASCRNHGQAREMLEQCRAMVEIQPASPYCLAAVHGTSALIHLLLGLYDLSESYALETYEIASKLDATNEGVVSNNVLGRLQGSKWILAKVYAFQDDFEKSLTYAQDGFNLVKDSNIPRWKSSHLSSISAALIGLGNPETAIETILPVVEHLPGDQKRIYVDTYAQLGLAYYQADLFDQSEQTLLFTLGMLDKVHQFGPTNSKCLEVLSSIAKRNGDSKKQVEYLNQHKKLQESIQESRHKNEISRLTALQEYKLKKQETELLLEGNQKLTEAYELLQRSYDEQAELLKLVLHDINNPLSAILLNSSVASKHLDTGNAEKAEKSIGNINRSADFALQIIEQLKKAHEVEDKKKKIIFQKLHFDELCRMAIERNLPMAAAKQIGLISKFEAQNSIFADELAMQQVLDNLISNAIKYSWPSSNVYLNTRRQDDYLVFECVDHGVGISEADIPRLFSKFGRLDTSRPTGDEQSTGLGLYIAKQLVTQMAGKITVHSDGLNKGCSFTVLIPLG